jgi:hypothetical protein
MQVICYKALAIRDTPFHCGGGGKEVTNKKHEKLAIIFALIASIASSL